jgi:hypothetical protein
VDGAVGKMNTINSKRASGAPGRIIGLQAAFRSTTLPTGLGTDNRAVCGFFNKSTTATDRSDLFKELKI